MLPHIFFLLSYLFETPPPVPPVPPWSVCWYLPLIMNEKPLVNGQVLSATGTDLSGSFLSLLFIHFVPVSYKGTFSPAKPTNQKSTSIKTQCLIRELTKQPRQMCTKIWVSLHRAPLRTCGYVFDFISWILLCIFWSHGFLLYVVQAIRAKSMIVMLTSHD